MTIQSKKPLLILIFFFSVLVLITERSSRFEDENIALIVGDHIVRALFSNDTDLKREAAALESSNGIGILLGIPASMALRIFNTLFAARLVSAVFAAFYWASVLTLFLKILSFLHIRISTVKLVFLSAGVLNFVQAIPGSYFNQAMVLSEFPGLAFLFWGIIFLLEKKFKLAGLFFGLAATMKLNFLLYSPVLLITPVLVPLFEDHDSKDAGKIFKILTQTLVAFLVPLLTVMLIKFLAFGPQNFINGLKAALHWIIHTSGSGLAPQHDSSLTPPVNEWLSYTYREKSYYVLGTFFPILVSAFCILKKKSVPVILRITLITLTLLVLLGSFQWFILAQLKWWRRTYYFLVPGYLISIIFVFTVIAWALEKKSDFLVKLASLAVLLVSFYVQIRQTIYSAFENSEPLTYNQLHQFDWKNKYNNPVN